jgi:DNA primase
MAWVDFSAIKRAVSLEMVLQRYQVPRLYRARPHQMAGCCPIHGGRRDDSFRAHLGKNVFHCFACQAGGNVLDFIAAMEKCSVREAALQLQQWFGGASPVAPMALRRQASQEVWEGQLVRKREDFNPPLPFALKGVDPTHPYLAQRGIEFATAVAFGVGFYTGRGLLNGRIAIPIRNRHSEIVAYAGRAVDGRPPKYRLPASFRKTLELFNLHWAAATGSETVVLVEGYFDCLRVHQAGFPSVVALMGSSLSEVQERALLQHFERVILMLDGDEAGRAATRAIVARLSRSCSMKIARVQDGAQPDQMSSSAIRALLENLEQG